MLAPLPGDLVISEFLADPDDVSDVAGEWIELHNTRDHDLDLLGFDLSDLTVDSHLIATSVVVPAGGTVVLARNADAGTNGGVTAVYEYSSFELDEASDEIVLSFDTSLTSELSYRAIEAEAYDFTFIATGDNDADTDCAHETFFFEAEVPTLKL